MRRLADREAREHIVYHHGPGLDLAGEPLSASAVASPNGSGEAKVRIIGQTHRFPIVAERSDRQHGAKRFFAHHAHIVIHVRQHRRRVERWSQLAQSRAAYQQARTMRERVRHMRFDHPHLLFADHRANVGRRIHPVSEAQLAGFLRTGLDERRVQGVMNVAALDRKTGLSRIDAGAPDGSARRYINVGILEHNHRILAAQLQNDRQ